MIRICLGGSQVQQNQRGLPMLGTSAYLRPIEDVREMGLPADQIIYLDAALRAAP